MTIQLSTSIKNQSSLFIGSQPIRKLFIGNTLHWQKVLAVKYGAIYTRDAAWGTGVNSILCSDDWHLPVNANIDALFYDAIYSRYPFEPYYYPLGVEHIKEVGDTYWTDANPHTNYMNFNARAAGYVGGGTFMGLKTTCFWWRSSIYGNEAMWGISNYDNMWGRGVIGSGGWSMPIRIIKNSTTLTHGQEGTYTGNDGRIYRTICMGNEEWLADNLAETKFRNGNLITVLLSSQMLTAPALCYPNNDINNFLIN